MTRSLLRRIATLAALVMLATTLAPTAASAVETRDGATANATDQSGFEQITRLYQAIFNRYPDDGGRTFWLGRLQSGTSLRQIADLMVDASAEFEDTYGSLSNAQFVNQLYLNVQKRPADAGGLEFWQGRMANGLSRGGVVLGFSESTELRSYAVDRLYCAFFLRNPDTAGRAFWQGQFFDNNQSLSRIASQFASSPEFSTRYGNLSNREFVELIYKNVLGRNLPLSASDSGPDFWTSQLGQGALTRGDVMVRFSESREYWNRFEPLQPCPDAGKAAPVAQNDRATVLFANGSQVTIPFAANDTLPTGTVVRISQQGTNGTAVVDGRSIVYTRNGNNASSDTVKYTLTNDGITVTGTITITILGAGEDGIPTANDDFFTIAAGARAIRPLTNDVVDETVTIQSFTQPASGSVSVAGDGTFTFTSASTGTFTFTYTLTDGDDTSTATVTVTVTADATGDFATDRRIFLRPGETKVINLASGGGTVDSVGDVSHGDLVLDGNQVSYTPDAGYESTRAGQGLVGDSFTYTLINASGQTSSGVVDLFVLGEPQCEVFVNFGPAAAATDYTRAELYFSDKGCFELYALAYGFNNLTVVWESVTLDGAAVTPAADPNDPRRAFITVPAGNIADNSVTVAGSVRLSVAGQNAEAVRIGPFSASFARADGASPFIRNSFTGRTAVTINLDPPLPS